MATTTTGTLDSSPSHHLFRVSLSKEIIKLANCPAIDSSLSTHCLLYYGAIRGSSKYLSLLSNVVGVDKIHLTSLTAVTLAAYAYKVQSSNLLQEARHQYGQALQLVTSAISGKEAIKDSTIISILLLSTFETLTNTNPKSLSHIEAHMRGLNTAINLRGYHLMEHRSVLQLFPQMYSCLFMNCLLCSIRIPEELINIRKCAATSLDTIDPSWKMSDIVMKLANFRADVKDGLLCGNRNIVNAALEIDSEISSLAENIPVQWRFKILSIKEKSKLVFGTHYHVYSDLGIAYIWNYIRASRLLLRTEIRDQLRSIPPLSLLPIDVYNYQQSTKVLQQMTLDICATIPQYFGHLSAEYGDLLLGERSTLQENAFSSKASSDAIPPSAYFLFWPLFNAGKMTDSDIQRDWIIDRCRYIGTKTGVQQAFILADTLERGVEIFF
ncbi:hypothetical protein B7494_g8370 [Chlorociboria aeruginascens]|nr:hypothetical protein B7494_g8370 [Chlorociboria aeruginascens]